MAVWLSATGLRAGVTMGRVLKIDQSLDRGGQPENKTISTFDVAWFRSSDRASGQDVPVILVIRELDWSCLNVPESCFLAGIVTERPSLPTSIVSGASELALPIVSCARNVTEFLSAGEWLIIDGQNGDLIASPDDLAIAYFRCAPSAPLRAGDLNALADRATERQE